MRFKTNVRIFRGKMDLAPMVDVMFILVIFFLISTSYDFQPGYAVDLPKSKAPMVAGDKLVVVLAPRGDLTKDEGVIVFFNNEEVSWDALEVKLAERINDRTQPGLEDEGRLPTISLKAHENIPYKYIMRISALAVKLKVRVNQVVGQPIESN
ncbi:MAG: biopolymer transporter ExbD [Lentisphaerales bacterium]|nr:biopolymer transporter ExbD [Lentisphaerales bacterium]